MYPFFYRPLFEVIDDGWHLFSPEEAFRDLESMVCAQLFCTLFFFLFSEFYRPLAECLLFMLLLQTDEWRLSEVNKNFIVCPSYPSLVAVPKEIDDETLCKAAAFRHGGRFPVLSYYHKKNGMVSRAF